MSRDAVTCIQRLAAEATNAEFAATLRAQRAVWNLLAAIALVEIMFSMWLVGMPSAQLKQMTL